MSSRHLKKIYGASQKEELENETAGVPVEDILPSVSDRNRSKPFSRNPYDLLVLEDDTDKGEKGDDGCDHEESDRDATNSEEPRSVSKKKKRNAKKSQRKHGESGRIESATTSNSASPHSHNRVSKVKDQAQLSASASSSSIVYEQDLFVPDQRYLNTEFELKKIFGASLINKEFGKSGKRNRKRHNRVSGKLIIPKDKWPAVGSSGISMSLLEPKEIGVEYFKFEHNAYYQEIQKQFLRAINTNDPENILRIVQLHPYHVDSQIQLSEISKQSEDNQVAAELVEIGLHTMELAADSRFGVSLTNCRLEYKYQENRAFHLLLYKHINFVSQRACHRSALEMSKVLFNLDMSDPLCVTLMLDFFAIKAGECLWLVKVYNFYNATRNLSQLPNWSYSVALSLFLLSIGAENHSSTSSSSRKKTDDQHDFSDAEKEGYSHQSDELLQYSFLMFPTVVVPLMDKCGIKCDPKFKNHPYFNYVAQDSSPEPLRLLTDLYVWRSWHVWKNPAIAGWVEKNATIVMKIIDSKSPVLRDYEQKRRRRYQEGTTPRSVLRHIFLIGEKEIALHIPKELTKEAILAHDPLPPRDSVDIYRRERIQTRPVDETPPGILNALLQSFRLDLNIGAPNNLDMLAAAAAPPPVPEDQEQQGGAGAFHRSVNTFIEAMRNLLTVASSDARPGRNEENESNTDEELPDVE